MPKKRTKRVRKTPNKKKAQYQKWYHVMRKYGLTQAQWQQIYDDQLGCCFICGRTEAQIRRGRLKYLSVDHCHTTGRIRGLLCGHCNHNILPYFERNPVIARNLVAYLEKETHYGVVPGTE